MKKLLLITCILAVLFGETISIEKAWERFESTHEGLKAAQSDTKMAALKKESATSMYLPSITLTGSYTRLDEPVKIEGEIDLNALPIPLPGNIPYSMDLSEQDVFLANLHMLWPLYTGGKIDAAQKIYAAQLDEQKAKEQMQKDEAFLKFVKYYYGVVVAKSLYETRLDAQKALKIHYEHAKKMQENGQIAQIELLNTKVKYDNAKIKTTKAKHKYEIALSALDTSIHTKAEPSSKLFIYRDIKTLAEYEEETKENFIPLKIFDAKEKQSQALTDVKKADWYPQVVGVANYTLYKDDSVLMESLPTWFAGVIVKIDILKREDRSQETQIARLLQEKVRHKRLEALEGLSILVKKVYKEMLASKEEFLALDSSVELAQQNYRLREISFKEGLSTSVEVIDAQTFLEAVRTKRLNAAYEFVQKLAQLSVLCGEREKFFEIQKIAQGIEK